MSVENTAKVLKSFKYWGGWAAASGGQVGMF